MQFETLHLLQPACSPVATSHPTEHLGPYNQSKEWRRLLFFTRCRRRTRPSDAHNGFLEAHGNTVVSRVTDTGRPTRHQWFKMTGAFGSAK
jgi:hypothetical protein